MSKKHNVMEKDNFQDVLKKMESRRVATVKQINLLIDFLQDNEDLRFGRVRSREGIHVNKQLWDVCAEKLNQFGPSRNSKEWAKYWSDLKSRVKLKVGDINKLSLGAGEGCSTAPVLTQTEARVIKLIGHDRINKRSHEVKLDRSERSSMESMNTTVVKEEKDEEMRSRSQEMNVEDFICTVPVVEIIDAPATATLPTNQPPVSEPISSCVSGNQPASTSTLQQPLSASGTGSNIQVSPTNQQLPQNQEQSIPPGESLTPNCTDLKEFANIMFKMEESHARTTRLQTEASLRMTEVLKLQAEGIMHTGIALREMANNLYRLLESQVFSRDRTLSR